jgi:hypothetical protein
MENFKSRTRMYLTDEHMDEWIGIATEIKPDTEILLKQR